MEIICNQTQLIGALNMVLKAVSAKTSYPILECILIETEDNSVRITANDNDLCIETVIPAVVNRVGRIAINARMFSDLIRKLPPNDVVITTDDTFAVSIVCGKAQFALRGLSGEEFPKPLEYDSTNPVVISQFTLKELIRQTIFAVSTNESSRVMTGEYFEIDGNRLRVTALDGFRVSIRNVELRGSYDKHNVIVPGKTLGEIGKILSGEMDEDVRICFDDRNIIFEFDNTIVHSRLIDGKYFVIDSMINAECDTKVTVNRRELIDSVDRSSLFVKETEKKPVVVEIFENYITVSINTQSGSMYDEIIAEREGNDMRIGFTPKFLLDILRVVDDDTVTLYMHNAKNPCFIRANDDSYIYMLLPVNIGAH
ncbi:MAG: DNA polymerase III subunit beta [Lachnospiraceae bacterium]|nr:DNA polymerase III subunit beta [Lachnospiraceae bacterium]